MMCCTLYNNIHIMHTYNGQRMHAFMYISDIPESMSVENTVQLRDIERWTDTVAKVD